MKRLIFILAVVCTVFIVSGLTCFAYEKGDTVAGITLASDFSECSDYMVLGDTLYLLNGTDLYVDTTRNNRIMSNTVGLWRIESDGSCGSVTSFNTFWFYFSDISKSSFNVKDENGNVVFVSTPISPSVGVVVPEGIQAVEIIPQAITSNLAVLLPLGLIVLAVFLGVHLIPRLIAFFL